jgi:hypothetical protein
VQIRMRCCGLDHATAAAAVGSHAVMANCSGVLFLSVSAPCFSPCGCCCCCCCASAAGVIDCAKKTVQWEGLAGLYKVCGNWMLGGGVPGGVGGRGGGVGGDFHWPYLTLVHTEQQDWAVRDRGSCSCTGRDLGRLQRQGHHAITVRTHVQQQRVSPRQRHRGVAHVRGMHVPRRPPRLAPLAHGSSDST